MRGVQEDTFPTQKRGASQEEDFYITIPPKHCPK